MSLTPETAARTQRSTLLLVVTNLLPLFGVLMLGWDVGALVILYWSENLIIGFYNILRMLTVGGVAGLFPSFFFLIHYGGFCAVHGFFIMNLLIQPEVEIDMGGNWPFVLVFLELLYNVISGVLATAPQAWIIAFIGLTISHGYSFVTNFLLGGERETLTVQKLMSQPYKRIFILHIAVIAGGFGVLSLGQPMVLLLALVVLKTTVDVVLHRREHRREESREHRGGTTT